MCGAILYGILVFFCGMGAIMPICMVLGSFCNVYTEYGIWGILGIIAFTIFCFWVKFKDEEKKKAKENEKEKEGEE